MSHSQFHSTNLFILRHAWLNLWDKHMTTGRINQVTTFREFKPPPLDATEEWTAAYSRSWNRFLSREFVIRVERISDHPLYAFRTCKSRTSPNEQPPKHHVPRYHTSQTHFPLSFPTELVVFRENYHQPALESVDPFAQSRRIPKWLIATGLAIGK